MKPESFAAGQTVFHKGDPGDKLYLITSGKLRIYSQDPRGNEITLTYYEQPRVFGDIALMDEQPRSASAIAIESLEVLALTRNELVDFLPDHPAIGQVMLRNLVDRVRYITVYLNHINDFGQRLLDGDYERALAEFAAVRMDSADSQINELIVAFGQMVHTLREQGMQPKTDDSDVKLV
jgi:CRP-like cAMP-binding protein